jgi:hypothetical protein
MVYIIEQTSLFFEMVLSLDTMSHIVKQIPGLKTLKGIPVEGKHLPLERGPHIEEGFGSAINGRVRLVEKPRPNSDVETRLRQRESPRPDAYQFSL